MRRIKRLLACSIVIFIAIISYAIINYMNCGHNGTCGDHSLTTTVVGSEDGELLWELKYETEVDAIIDIMSQYDDYVYPVTVDQLQTLDYLYCRGHGTYLRGTGSNTITREGSLSGSSEGNSYTFKVKTGLSGPLGKTDKAEMDTYEYADTKLTFNEWSNYSTTYKTAKEIYTDMEQFVIPGINGESHRLINDDHNCDGDDKQYRYEFENIQMDSMSRFKLKKEVNGPEATVTHGEELYTDENEAVFMAYDAAKAYIFTVIKGGHYGVGQLASWNLRDQLNLTQNENAEYEIHDAISKGITSEETVKSVLGLEEEFLHMREITKDTVIDAGSGDNEGSDSGSDSDEYQESTMDYNEKTNSGDAGVLFEEAVMMAKHVYATETFKDSHNDALIADCTDKENLNVSYVKNGDYYLVGPFTLEYIRSVMQSSSSLIPEVSSATPFSLGGLTKAEITYTRINGETGTLAIDKDTSDFEFVVIDDEKKLDRGFDSAYKFPYPEENFYLKVPYQGEDEQTAIKTLDKIEYTIDNTYAKGLVYNIEGRHSVITWGPSDPDECTFACEEAATVCQTHHTSSSHCITGCPGYGCYDYHFEYSDCEANVCYEVDDGGYCYGHCYSNCQSNHSYCYKCPDHTACNDETYCETHHHVAGDGHARNRAYWIEVKSVGEPVLSQPLMWMRNASVHRRTYTATSELNLDMTMDFGGFVWVDAYTQKNSEGLYYGDNVYDPTIQIDDQGIDAKKQYVDVYLLKKVAEGETATGEKYESSYGDPGTTGDKITDDRLYYVVDGEGNKIYDETDENGDYSFDYIPVLNSTYEGYVVVFIYDGQTYTNVSPLYKQVGKSSTYAGEEYISNENKYTDFDISSMGAENPDERKAFNAKFDEFLGKEDINIGDKSTNGLSKGVSGNTYDLHYVNQNDGSGRVTSKLQTLENNKPLDLYKFESRTSEVKVGDKSLVYPLTDVYNIKLSDKADIDISGTNVSGGEDIEFTDVESVYGSDNTGYTQHINLGIRFRPQSDLSVTKDLYSARTVVKGNDMTYAYGEALRNEEYFNYGGLGTGTVEWDDTKKVQKAISDKKIVYQLFLYEADREYNSAVEYISASEEIQKVRMGRYASSAGYGKTFNANDLFYNQARGTGSSCYVCDSGSDLCNYHKAELFDTELRTYLTYKITIRNENVKTVYAEVNELLDYHDETLELIDRDVYAAIVNENGELLREDGKANAQVVASGSKYYYYEAGTDTIKASGDVTWTEDGTEDGVGIKTNAKINNKDFDTTETVTYQKLKTGPFKYVDETGNEVEIKLAKNERIEIYVTYRVKEERKTTELQNGFSSILAAANGFEGEVGQVLLGKKFNIAEVSNYSTYRKDTGTYERYGRVDKDSAPDNINLRDGDKANYDDDGDAAPPIEIRILDEEETESIIPGVEKDSISNLQKDYGGSRTITGVVWEDARTVKIGEYEQYIGDGEYDKGSEPGIPGVTVQLIEKVQTLRGTEEDFLNPDVLADPADVANGKYKDGIVSHAGKPGTSTTAADVGNTSYCEYKFETKTDSTGTYSFKNIPAGTYVVRFIYGSEIIETPYYAMVEAGDGDEIVSYGPANEIEVTAEEMPLTYNGQDYKSTTYQVNIDNDINGDGYIDNEWDNIDITNLGYRISDARDNEVRRLENIAYSRTVNNKVATELDALTTKSTNTLEKYNFSVGIINGAPAIMIKDDMEASTAAVPNAQVQKVTQSDGNYKISTDTSLIYAQDIAATPNVAQYTWMYADTAKFVLGIENDTLIRDTKVSEVIDTEYTTEFTTLIGESINQDGNLLEMGKKMLEPVTTLPRIIEDTSIGLKDADLREAAMIYNIVPGQITVGDNSNFSVETGTVLDKYGYSSSATTTIGEISSYPAANRIYNIDFGIVERPKNSVELQKWVSSLELTLSDGRQLFYIPFNAEYDDTTGEVNSVLNKEGCTSEVYDTSTEEGVNELVSHFTTQKSMLMNNGIAQGFIYVNMDEELLQGATISVGYGMKVINTSEVDTVGLLSFFDDGDTIMQLADYIKALSSKTTTTTAFTAGGPIGSMSSTFLGAAASKYAGLAATETNPLLKIKYANLAERFEKSNAKLASVSDIAKVNSYTINNPSITTTGITGGSQVQRASTPYGLFVGTTYYTGAVATDTAKVYAVESKVEQIIDYVDNELGTDDSELMLIDGSWAKLDLTQLFGNYVQSNVLNGINSSEITNEGTLINIFESAVINISQELLTKIGATIDLTSGEIEKEYRTVYEKLLSVAGVNITLQELVHSLGEEGIQALIAIYNASDATTQSILEMIVSGLTVVDKEGNRYITLEFNDANEIKNNVLITVNDPARNPSLGNYLVPKTLIKAEDGTDRAAINIKGTNNGTTEDNTKFEADINLIAKKTVSAEALASDIENMVFNNAAEIVQISNKVGRKDKMAVAGNLLIGEGEWESTTGYDPDDGKEINPGINPDYERETLPGQPIFAEYDSAATARIIFAPPTGQGISAVIHSDIFQGGLIGLIVLAIGILVIRITFFKKKKIYK